MQQYSQISQKRSFESNDYNQNLYFQIISADFTSVEMLRFYFNLCIDLLQMIECFKDGVILSNIFLIILLRMTECHGGLL